MTRTLTSGMQTAVAADQAALCHLIQMETSGGTVRMTTAPVDLSWDSQTWTGIGGAMVFNAVVETSDERQSGVELHLSAVDQTVMAAILNNHFRGQTLKIWMVHIDPDAGTIIADPLLLFQGFQNSGWRMSEQREEEGGGGSATLVTRIVSRLAELAQSRGIKCNVTSHQQYFSGDTFFQNVPDITGKVVVWGGYQRMGGSPPGGPRDPLGGWWP